MENGEQIEILLVEDNPNDVELTLRAFKRKNLNNKVHVVTDGEKALDFIFCRGIYSGRSFTVPPKVVILDLKLPLVDGKEVLKAVRADPRTKDLPVVVLTSSHEESDVIASYDLGVNSYIVKPVDFEKFSQMVSELGWYWVAINKAPVH
ncbi:MAG: response regulator [Candidatus Omnitrophota bacterium]